MLPPLQVRWPLPIKPILNTLVSCSQVCKLFGFHIFWLWVYQMRFIPETRRLQYIWHFLTRYLCLFELRHDKTSYKSDNLKWYIDDGETTQWSKRKRTFVFNLTPMIICLPFQKTISISASLICRTHTSPSSQGYISHLTLEQCSEYQHIK